MLLQLSPRKSRDNKRDNRDDNAYRAYDQAKKKLNKPIYRFMDTLWQDTGRDEAGDALDELNIKLVQADHEQLPN